MTVEELPRDPNVLNDAMETQDLLDFEQDMVLLLPRDLKFFHRGMKVLMVEARRGAWMVAPQSDFYFMQQLRQPILLSTFVKQNQWLPEGFIQYVVFFLYTKGLLEVNGSSIWEPLPLDRRKPGPFRNLSLHLEHGGRDGWRALQDGLTAVIRDRDPRPVDLMVYGVSSANARETEQLLAGAHGLAEERKLPLRISLNRTHPETPLDMVGRLPLRVGLAGGSSESILAAVKTLREREVPFQVELPWPSVATSLDALWRVLEAGSPAVGLGAFDLPEADFGPPAEARGHRMLQIVDEILAKDVPPFYVQELTPLLGRLTQFPWQVGVTECHGFTPDSACSDREAVCWPCQHFVGVPKAEVGRLGKGPFDRWSSGSARAREVHRADARRSPWWFPFYHACPGVAWRFHGGPGPDPRSRMIEVLVEGLMWRVSEATQRLAAQFGLMAPPAESMVGGEHS